MRYKFFMVFSLFLVLFSCEEEAVTNIGEDPIVNRIQMNYTAEENSLFLAADVDDPQGTETIQNIESSLFFMSENDSVEQEIELGELVDNGEDGDIIPKDGIFSKKIYDMATGRYRLSVQPVDLSGNMGNIVDDTLQAFSNQPPEIYLYSAPDRFEKGDAVSFEVKVTDPNGMSDIKLVEIMITNPDGDSLGSWEMNDLGLYGDETASDGIYSLTFPTNAESKDHGFWWFYFQATDKENAKSERLEKKVSNPGVAVLYPDGGETFSVGETIALEWDLVFVDTVVVEYTTNAHDNSPDYHHITEQPSHVRTFDWMIPDDAASENCKIHIYDKRLPTRDDKSDGNFEVTE